MKLVTPALNNGPYVAEAPCAFWPNFFERKKMKILVRMMLCLMISFTLIELPMMKAHAGSMITTETALEMSRGHSEKKVSNFIERQDVQKQMIKFGVNPQEASRRLAGLSDAEVKKIAGEIDKSTVGGDIGGILVLVLVILMIIYFAKRI